MEYFIGKIFETGIPFLVVFTPAFALAFWWVGGLWKEPERKTFVLWLKHDRSRHLYRHLITRALDAVSGFLGRREVRIRTGPGWDEAAILERNRLPWSWGLLDFALLIAIAYPVFSVIGQWAIFGQGKLGSLSILPRMEWVDRWFPLFLLTCSGMTYFWAMSAKNRLSRALFLPCLGLFVWFILKFEQFSDVSAFGDDLLIAGTFSSVVVYAIIPAVVFAILIIFTKKVLGVDAFTIVIATAVAGAFATVLAFASATTPIYTGSGPLTIAGAGSLAIAFAVAVAVGISIAGDWVRKKRERRMMRSPLALLAWLLVLFVLLLFSAVWSQQAGSISDDNIAALLLFLGFVPLLNAVADFASTGLTRHFLAQGAAGHPLRFGLFDIAAGAATFFGLGFAMIGTIALVKVLGGPELINLDVLLGPRGIPDAILTDPHAYWWLYLTFLSTLLPTVLHGFIATFAFVLMWPERLRMWLAKSLDSGSYVAGRPACLALAALIALSVALPLTLLYYIGWALALYYPHAGEMLIGIFRDFAALTGAI